MIDIDPVPAVLGAAGLGALAWLTLGDDRQTPSTGRAGTSAPHPGGAAAIGAWVFPVPNLGDRVPEISDGWGSRRWNDDGSKRAHLGADIMFRRRHRDDQIELYRPGTPNGTKGYFMPDGVPVLAASAGVVTFAKRTRQGFTITIAHPVGWTTYYTHLASIAVAVGQAVDAGQVIGVVGGSPLDPRHLMHLHFELWRDHKRSGATNPGPYLLAWRRHAVAAGALRNKGMTYRPIGAFNERYPDWIQSLRGKSGVYIIRERAGRKPVVYVGESHTDRLYETLTRHFQTWRRKKKFWKGYVSGHDPGLTYPRDEVEVAVRVLPWDEAQEEEARLIQRLRPRDNLIGQPEREPELEDAPF